MNPIHVKSIAELEDAAQTILESIDKNRIICLYGTMGVGKTTLIKAICRKLGVADNVVSPTFALINEYKSPKGMPIYHFDFYRINKIEEVFDFGYEEYFYSKEGICLIEWPELVENILPEDGVVKISITANIDESRTIELLNRE